MLSLKLWGEGVKPCAVLRCADGTGQVDMPVSQLVHHVREHFVEVFPRHVGRDALGVAGVHFVPVQPVFFVLVVEEAILLVDDFPQRFEVGFGAYCLKCLRGCRRRSRDRLALNTKAQRHGDFLF